MINGLRIWYQKMKTLAQDRKTHDDDNDHAMVEISHEYENLRCEPVL